MCWKLQKSSEPFLVRDGVPYALAHLKRQHLKCTCISFWLLFKFDQSALTIDLLPMTININKLKSFSFVLHKYTSRFLQPATPVSYNAVPLWLLQVGEPSRVQLTLKVHGYVGLIYMQYLCGYCKLEYFEGSVLCRYSAATMTGAIEHAVPAEYLQRYLKLL